MESSNIIFTDGACTGNPGPGGWGTIYCDARNNVVELGGGESKTTNNRMEMTAVLMGIKRVPKDQLVTICCDSTYVLLGIEKWMARWKKNGWKTALGADVQNQDLWMELDAAFSKRPTQLVTLQYVKGHSGCPGNERCDRIAVAYSLGKHEPLYHGPLAQYGIDLTVLTQGTTPKSSKRRRKIVGGFYLSLVLGQWQRHDTWEQCRLRVYGVSGASFKKVSSTDEQEKTLRDWGVC